MQVTEEEKRNLIVIEKTIYKENEKYRSAKLKKKYIYVYQYNYYNQKIYSV
jgi:hypothetical protein